MIWLLDTNACIRYLNGRSVSLKNRLDAANDVDVVVCSVVKAELYFGSARSTDPIRSRQKQDRFLSRFVSLPFDDPAADAYASLRAALAASGKPIGPNDMLIAAIALAHGLTLVTNNTSEFSRVAGLSLEDWESAPP